MVMNKLEAFGNVYKNKKVLITGHTGFKGSWLLSWLLKLGANVVGISNDIPTEPSMFEVLNETNQIKDLRFCITNIDLLKSTILKEKPDFIFHLAAQPIVSKSYFDPHSTIMSNVIGTTNLLESLRFLEKDCIAIIITSDKCYENIETLWGYKETDKMGGKDIYSASKGAAELIIKSYFESFLKNNIYIKIGIARAGNVIGGGDWALDRIVADSVRAWSNNNKVEIRSPLATRPWQHVLEPLSGYLRLGQILLDTHSSKLNGEAFNFGPKSEQNHTVVKLLKDLGKYWGFNNENDAYIITDNIPFNEAGLLKLNCEKALHFLNWEPTLSYDETINFIGDWYNAFYLQNNNMKDFTYDQIDLYENKALLRNQKWIK
jgi:CDP-glucose 4,6-dehydratase